MKIPLFEAISRRLNRVYLSLMSVIVVSWGLRITLFAPDGVDVWTAASIPPVSGAGVIGIVCVFYVVMLGVVFLPTDRQAKGKKREVTEETKQWRT